MALIAWPGCDLGQIDLGGRLREHVGRRGHLVDQRKQDRDAAADRGKRHRGDVDEVAAARIAHHFGPTSPGVTAVSVAIQHKPLHVKSGGGTLENGLRMPRPPERPRPHGSCAPDRHGDAAFANGVFDGRLCASLLYQPDIAGNVGTILRLAACLGVGVDLIEPMGFAFGDRALARAGMDYASAGGGRRATSTGTLSRRRRRAAWCC